MISSSLADMLITNYKNGERDVGLKHFRVALIAGVAALQSCATHFEASLQQNSESGQFTIVELDESVLRDHAMSSEAVVRRHHPVPEDISSGDYIVGAGDVLSVIVWDHPELTIPAGPQRTATESGQLVQADGAIFYPYVGRLKVAGKTVPTIRKELTSALSEYLPDPQVDVQVAEFRSKSVLVTGQVVSPQKLALTDRPLRISEAVSAAGGAKPSADLRQASIRRGNDNYSVDLDELLNKGIGVDVSLQNGDVVNIPEQETEVVFVSGAVRSPASVDISSGEQTLLQVVQSSGGLSETARKDGLSVLIREMPENGAQVYSLNLNEPKGMLIGSKLVVRDGDVIHVVASGTKDLNRIIANAMPSIAMANALDALSN